MTTKLTLQPTRLVGLHPEAIPLPSKILVLFGPTAELHPLVLQSIFLRAQRGERTGLIIGDNHLNEYALARLMRGHGFNPTTLLSNIEFSRPFTCHQLHHAVLNLVADRVERWSALYVLGLLDTFYDEDIRYPIVSQLLNDILARLRSIASQGLSVLVVIAPPPKETTRTEFITRVIDSADAYWQLTPQAIEHAERIAQSALW